MARTSLNKAVESLLEHLPENKLVTPNELSEQLQINWKTIMKAAKLIQSVQEKLPGSDMELLIEKVGNTYALRLSKTLEKMSTKERLSYLRKTYFPKPEIEDVLFVELFKKGATQTEKAIEIQRDKLISKLIQQGQLAETEEGKVYLTDEGVAVAIGTLKLFPELK